jgi:uncharacterized membrane protein
MNIPGIIASAQALGSDMSALPAEQLVTTAGSTAKLAQVVLALARRIQMLDVNKGQVQ